MKFVLEITMGNDAMQTPDDVSDALWETAGRLQGGTEWAGSEGRVRDLNGNTVGRWTFKEETA